KGYEDMNISDGSMAIIEFYKTTYLEIPEEERNRVRAELKKYCGRDTEGMSWIVDKLRDISR
ncbi:DUF2779 domain-containing protein, partial [Chloroflexota bacterium]